MNYRNKMRVRLKLLFKINKKIVALASLDLSAITIEREPEITNDCLSLSRKTVTVTFIMKALINSLARKMEKNNLDLLVAGLKFSKDTNRIFEYLKYFLRRSALILEKDEKNKIIYRNGKSVTLKKIRDLDNEIKSIKDMKFADSELNATLEGSANKSYLLDIFTAEIAQFYSEKIGQNWEHWYINIDKKNNQFNGLLNDAYKHLQDAYLRCIAKNINEPTMQELESQNEDNDELFKSTDKFNKFDIKKKIQVIGELQQSMAHIYEEYRMYQNSDFSF